MERTAPRYTAHGPPNERGFVHKRIIGAIGGGIKGFLGGGPLGGLKGAAGGFLGGGQGGTMVPERIPIQQVRLPIPDPRRFVPPAQLGGGGGCPPGFVFQNGRCLATVRAPTPGFGGRVQRLLPGGATGFEPDVTVQPVGAQDFGEATMGRFGAGLEPAVRSTSTRICPRGSILAVDGLCYNRRDLRNSERAWPRGRRPLLTGGEMRCITVAASAAKKLQTKQKQLMALGLLKRPAPRRAVPAGHRARLEHASGHD